MARLDNTSVEKVYDTQGVHIIMELSGCPATVIGNIGEIESALRLAAEAARTTILELSCHRFSPTGISGVAVVAESHISIHTWPERGYAAIDVYTCGQHVKPQEACLCLKDCLKAQKARCSAWQRGIVAANGEYEHRQLELSWPD